MKLIRSPEQISLRGVNITVPVNASFWDLLHSISSPSNQRDLLSLFYASIPPQMRAMLVDQEFASSVVFILMPFLPVDKTREAVNGVNGAIDAGASARTSTKILHMAGVQTVTLAVNDLIIQGQIISLIVALALTFIHIWLVFGDFRVAVLTMVPVTVVSTLEPLILVLLSIPLSTVTVMIGSIAIGTGVDFAVQITQRMRLEGYTQKSINEAVEKAGVSFVEATSTMVAGFAGMLAMNIVSIQQFVYMIIILLVLNMIAAMFLFPALGSIWVRRRKRAPPSVGLYVRMLRSLRDAVTEPRPRHAARATEREK
jgi:predicted RND superfamily exporter protein